MDGGVEDYGGGACFGMFRVFFCLRLNLKFKLMKVEFNLTARGGN